jgi:ParB family transcriptional regulator, chromosome partitioning protein
MKPPMKKRLGRGLDALLSDKPADAALLSQARQIAISQIRPNRYQPRQNFDPEVLSALTESVRRDGVLMPILVRPMGDGYELIAGERRWRASQAAGLLEIPSIVRDVDDLQALELAIVENEQRDNLTAIESARAYQRMMDEFGCTQQQVAERIGVSRAQVTNITRLLQLSDKIQKLIEKRELTMGQARPLVGLARADAEHLASECVAKGWSARQMERAVQHVAKASGGRKTGPTQVDVDVAALQEELTRRLGLPVSLVCRRNGSGELRIAYTRPEELDGVLERLRR